MALSTADPERECQPQNTHAKSLPGAHPAQGLGAHSALSPSLLFLLPCPPSVFSLACLSGPLCSHFPVSFLLLPSCYFTPLLAAGSLGPLTLSPPLPQLCVPASISLPVASPPFPCSAKARREFSQWRYPVALQNLGGLLNKRIWSPTLRVPGFPLFRNQASRDKPPVLPPVSPSAFWPG